MPNEQELDGRTLGVTSPKDRSSLNERWSSLSDDGLNAAETQYILLAQKKRLLAGVTSPIYWFNVPFLLKVHNEMLGSIWEWAGKFRKTEKSIGIPFYQSPQRLEELCQDVIYWNLELVDMTFLEQACRIHHHLVEIHPFEDGNGLHARLIADRYLQAHRCSCPLWPDNLHQESTASRTRYIISLRDADKGNYEPLLQVMEELGARDLSIGKLLASPITKSIGTRKK